MRLIIVLLFLSTLTLFPLKAYCMGFDPDNNNQFFNPNDSNNIGYYLNNFFYNNLSQKEIIVTHSWDIRYEDGSGSQSNVSAKVGMISYTEYQSYKNIIMMNSPLSKYWTRTPVATTEQYDFTSHVWNVYSDGDLVISNSNFIECGVRPTLYLQSGYYDESPGSIINFSGFEWIILNQNNYTYVISRNNISEDYLLPSPQPPSSLQVADITTSSVDVSWTLVSGVDQYAIYLDGSKIGTTSTNNYNISGLQPGTTYQVSVAAVQDGIEGNKCNPVSFATEEEIAQPTAPAGLSINNITTTSAQANWTSLSGAEEYNVYLDGVMVGTTGISDYNLSGLQPGTTYQVSVAAVQGGVEGEKCAPVTFDTQNEELPIWTPLPGPGMGFYANTENVFDNFKFIFGLIKGSIWPFAGAFLGLFTLGLLWKIWRRVAR